MLQRILIVDDEEAILSAMKDYLEIVVFGLVAPEAGRHATASEDE